MLLAKRPTLLVHISVRQRDLHHWCILVYAKETCIIGKRDLYYCQRNLHDWCIIVYAKETCILWKRDTYYWQRDLHHWRETCHRSCYVGCNMVLNISMYIDIYTYIYIHTHTHIYVCIHIHTYIYIY